MKAGSYALITEMETGSWTGDLYPRPLVRAMLLLADAHTLIGYSCTHWTAVLEKVAL